MREHEQLRKVAELADEYAELAERTDNGDLIALIFQLREVLRDDSAPAVSSDTD